MLFGTPGLGQHISGVILFDETMRHSTEHGKSFLELLKEQDICIGIKVDKGLKVLPGTDNELVTQGLTDLDVRCKGYYEKGARFSKWRAVFNIGINKPSQLAIDEQARNLARYAAISQANGLVPIVEPEVLMDGNHDIEDCAFISERVYSAVFKALNDHHVLLEGMLLKPNMVTQGADCEKKASPDEIAFYTVRTLANSVPPSVPGIVFLSGGQSEEEASLNLNAINRVNLRKPWVLTFSFGRALQDSALKAWNGSKENFQTAREILFARSKACGEAQQGSYEHSSVGTSSTSLYEKKYTY